MHQFEITPKAFANFSPGFERSREPWENNLKSHQTLKGLDSCRTLAGFNDYFCDLIPGLSLRLQPWGNNLKSHQTLKGLDSYRTLAGVQ